MDFFGIVRLQSASERRVDSDPIGYFIKAAFGGEDIVVVFVNVERTDNDLIRNRCCRVFESCYANAVEYVNYCDTFDEA